MFLKACSGAWPFCSRWWRVCRAPTNTSDRCCWGAACGDIANPPSRRVSPFWPGLGDAVMIGRLVALGGRPWKASLFLIAYAPAPGVAFAIGSGAFAMPSAHGGTQLLAECSAHENECIWTMRMSIQRHWPQLDLSTPTSPGCRATSHGMRSFADTCETYPSAREPDTRRPSTDWFDPSTMCVCVCVDRSILPPASSTEGL